MGSWIAEDLATLKSFRVVGTDLERYTRSKPAFEFVQGDLRDREFVVKLARRVKPQMLIHLASNAREGASQFQPYSSTSNNMAAYANVLEQCIKGGVKKVVLFSSMSVYGDQAPPFDESMPRKPVDVYAVNKAGKEQLTEILSRTYGFTYTIIRPHNVFGEWQNLKDRYRNVIAIFMNSIMNKEPIYVHGDGSQKRAFSYILDSLPCYRRLVMEEFHPEVFNIGGKVEISINDVADRVVRAMGEKKWKIIHTASRPGEVKDAWCTTTKSERLLGYQEVYGLDRGIDRMAAWALKRGPARWTDEKLELHVSNMPTPWRA